MLFNLIHRKTKKPLSGCRAPMTVATHAGAEIAGFVKGCQRLADFQQPEELKQLKQKAVQESDFITWNIKGSCGFATGIRGED